MMEEILPLVKQTAADDPPLRADPTELGFLPIERFTKLEIPVPDLQEAHVFLIHRARWTEIKAFHNGGARNDWVWVQTGAEDS